MRKLVVFLFIGFVFLLLFYKRQDEIRMYPTSVSINDLFYELRTNQNDFLSGKYNAITFSDVGISKPATKDASRIGLSLYRDIDNKKVANIKIFDKNRNKLSSSVLHLRSIREPFQVNDDNTIFNHAIHCFNIYTDYYIDITVDE